MQDIDKDLFCQLNLGQVNRNQTLLGPPRSGKSTFVHYNNLALNEEEIGFVNIKKEEYSTEKIWNKIKNAITSNSEKIFGKLIKIEEFREQFGGRISEKDMELLENSSNGRISSKIIYHIETLLKDNKTPILYWLNKKDIELKGYSNEEVLKLAKINWLGIDYYPPKLLKYDIEKLKEARDNYEKFCRKMQIPVSGEDFYKMQRSTFFIGFVPESAGNVLSKLTGLLGNLTLPGIITQVILASVAPLISGVIAMGIITLMAKKENIDEKAEIIEIADSWEKMDEEFKHIVAAKIAFETGFTEEEVFDAYEKISGISENKLLSKILDQIKPELDELRKQIEDLREQLYSKGTEKIKDINTLRDKLNIQDRNENLIGLGNSENDRKVREQINIIINKSQDHICIIEGEAGSGKTTLLYMIGKSLLDKGSRVYYIEELGPFSFLDFPKLDAYAIYDVKDRKIAEKILGEKLREAILNNTPLARVIISVRTSYLMDSKFNELSKKDGFNSFYKAQVGYSKPILLEIAIRSLKNSFPNISQDHLDEASKILVSKSENLPLYIKEAVKMLEKKGFSLEVLKNIPYGTANMILSILSEEGERDSSLIFVYFLVANYPRFPKRLLEYIENFFDIHTPNYMDESSDRKLSLHSWYRDVLYSIMDTRNQSDIIKKLDIPDNSDNLLGLVKEVIEKRNIFYKIRDSYKNAFEDFTNNYPNNPVLSELSNYLKGFFKHPSSLKPLDLSDAVLLSSIIGYVESKIRRNDKSHYGFNVLDEKVDYSLIEPSSLGAYNELIGFLVNGVAVESSRISEGEIRPFYLFLLIVFMNLFDDKAINTLKKEFSNIGAQHEMNYEEIYYNSLDSSYVIQRYIKAFFSALRLMGFLAFNHDNSPKQIYRMALIYSLELDFEDAIQEYNKAIELDPNNPIYHNSKANILYDMGKYQDAIQEYNKAVELDPNNPFYHDNKGLAQNKLHRYEDAIQEYNKAIELDPNNPIYHNNKGNALAQLGRYQEAIVEYNKAIELNPNNPIYHNNKGLAQNKLHRYEDAIKEFDKAIELDPNEPIYHNNKGLALTLVKLHKYEDAIEEFDKAIELNPNSPIYHNNKGITLGKLHKYEDAIKEFDKAIELDPNNPDYQYNKRLAQDELNQNSKNL